MRDEQLQAEMAQLAMNLQALMPTEGERYPFSGDEPVTLSEAMRMMEQLQQMEELERQLEGARYGSGVDEIDAEKMSELVGAEEGQALQQLQELARMLEEEGYLEERGGKMELTPRGIRKIGQKALQDIFQYLKRDAFGKHSDAPARARRRAHRRQQGVRVRRPLLSRPARHLDERRGAGRRGRARAYRSE